MDNESPRQIMDNKPSIDEMWKVIEKHGIKRESLDPYNDITYETVQSLYVLIKNRQLISRQLTQIKSTLKLTIP
jgi:hypothetical protein